MKKLLLLLLATALGTTSSFAQEIKLSGEVKTGVYWRESQRAGDPADSNTLLHSMDDAGSEGQQGRIRMNLDYDNGNGFGIRVRYNLENLNQDYLPISYAFGYGNFFENQLTVAIGKLGGSPWDTGGPEMWKQLENNTFGGMRVEWKPAFIPESAGKLNIGFVLNWFNSEREAAEDAVDRQTLLDILKESVIGASYTHDLFMVRLAYRFDSEVDARRGLLNEGDTEGTDLIYRIEEHVIQRYLPGFSVWALGHLEGVGSNRPDIQYFRNWLFAQYAPDLFTAQLRFGYEFMDSRGRFYVKPSFYWNFFDKLLTAGVSFQYAQDFGDGKIWEGSPFEFIELEPKVQLNFSSSYIAFVYNWKREYVNPDYPSRRDLEPIKQTHRINLRFCIYY
jgi:hypothetical protein